ncbi:MAG TPA: transcriptional repressor, partial [Candidatus Marinimicrobia bacterium]|nr:transcriptional repressor [Candidatus Neomarinimicrobiota bacterium]
VYRNLNILRKEGLIKELLITGNKSYFEGNTKPHAHFICERCHDIVDVDFPKGNLSKSLNTDGYEVTQIRLEFFGICPACLTQAVSNKKTEIREEK